MGQNICVTYSVKILNIDFSCWDKGKPRVYSIENNLYTTTCLGIKEPLIV